VAALGNFVSASRQVSSSRAHAEREENLANAWHPTRAQDHLARPQDFDREDIVAPAAQSLAAMPTMEAIVEMKAAQAIVEVKAAVVAEVVEMMEPFEPRSAAIKCLGPNIVSVARPIGVIPATCLGA
jgi:hypothetical protein